ncbi:sensor histidine kinase [Conexibacter arvalis]|uniref:histidine kinase n=1 Tax=Conexibacter arvalis TaxID=912552 RepID=A0A840ILK7_9ACTN|nr:histidine kinase [Conexibacter arvalis]MBB4664780.1 signal transduction histidine kinase [Conexibacter arvalis]
MLWLGACITVALTAGAAAVPLLAPAARSPDVNAVVLGLVVAVPAGIGLLALARSPDDRFARLLLITAFGASAVALAGTTASLPYSIGRVAIWLVELPFAYLVLSFPSGRLAGPWERRAFAALVAMALALWLATALAVPEYPLPSAWALCGLDCPQNAFQLTASEPAVIESVVKPVRELLVVGLWFWIVAILAVRAHRAGPLLRRGLIPLAVTAALRNVALLSWFVVRAIDPSATETLQVVGWLYMLSLPLIAVGVGTGLLLRRLYAAIALERFVIGLPPHPSAVQARATLAHTIDDPTLRILHRSAETGGWLDEEGAPAPAPDAARPGVTMIEVDGAAVAAILHDETLAQDRVLLRAAGRFSHTVVENDRLVGRLRTSLRDLSQSRARTAMVADETRRRIERDLHDGAQQRLVALRIRLTAAAERLAGSRPESAAALRALGDDVEQTLDELRDLAHGIYPAALTDRGLVPALTGAALAAPLAVSVRATGSRRYRPEIESAVYFACMEALQNSVKHADGATRVEISLTLGGVLAFEVRDDGAGFAVDGTNGTGGAGLANLHDRLAAVGGEVRVESTLSAGTRVAGTVPVDGRGDAPAVDGA